MTNPIILFDGVCNLCHASVQWVIRRDPKGIFKFASLQSPAAARLLPAQPSKPTPDSVYLTDNGRIWEKSDAWIEIVKRLGPPWSWLGALGIFPRGLRDAIYDFIAKRRYRWFGKKDACPLPDPKLKDRFLS